MSSLDIVCWSLNLLLQLLNLVHWQRRYCFCLSSPIAWCFPLVPILILPIWHSMVVLLVFFLDLLQLTSKIFNNLFSSLTALFFIILILSYWHRHHSIIFACRRRLGYRSIVERKLIDKAAWFFSSNFSLFFQILWWIILAWKHFVMDFCWSWWLLLIVRWQFLCWLR